MLGWRARVRLERGEWALAEQDAVAVLSRYQVLDIMRFPSLVVLGLLRARRGEPGAEALLDQALKFAAPSGEMQRMGPAVAARAEAAWIRGDISAAEPETRAAYELAFRGTNPWYRGPVAYWFWRMGGAQGVPETIAELYRRQMQGDWRAAADTWQRLGCPFERALARRCRPSRGMSPQESGDGHEQRRLGGLRSLRSTLRPELPGDASFRVGVGFGSPSGAKATFGSQHNHRLLALGRVAAHKSHAPLSEGAVVELGPVRRGIRPPTVPRHSDSRVTPGDGALPGRVTHLTQIAVRTGATSGG